MGIIGVLPLFFVFIYSLAASGLRCSTWDLLWRVGSGACSLLSSRGAQAQLLRGMWDLSSPTRDRTGILYIARRILNHWTTRKVPFITF